MERAEAARELCGLSSQGPVVTLLPGSRRNEVDSHLADPAGGGPDCSCSGSRSLNFLLALGRFAPRELSARIAEAMLPPDFPLRVLKGSAREAILAADVVLAKPGTVTLEAALARTADGGHGTCSPADRVGSEARSYGSTRSTLPNLIAGEAIVPEFLQQDATADRLVRGRGEALQRAAAGGYSSSVWQRPAEPSGRVVRRRQDL